MKKSFNFLVGGIGFVTMVFVVLGLVFAKDDNEKQSGLTTIYDVSQDGTLAYVSFEDGKAGIYLSNGNVEPVVQLPIEHAILDISFSIDGNILAYVVSDKEISSESESAVHLLHMDTNDDQLVFRESALITELAFDPKDSKMLFYLQADTFTNYSSVARPYPHDFDVHSIHLDELERKKYTDLKKYDMRSLQVSPTDESVFVQMADDESVQTPEDLFASKQRIFEIPLQAPEEKTIVSDPAGQEDIYDFVLLPERQEIVYQAVAGTGSDGIFEYELFSFNWETFETKQLTNLKSYTEKPILGPEDQIYFMVNRRFGGRLPDYEIYKMSADGKNIQEVVVTQE